jgi:hypothetical protein
MTIMIHFTVPVLVWIYWHRRCDTTDATMSYRNRKLKQFSFAVNCLTCTGFKPRRGSGNPEPFFQSFEPNAKVVLPSSKWTIPPLGKGKGKVVLAIKAYWGVEL